jgi:cobalt/nickel transport system permease protein
MHMADALLSPEVGGAMWVATGATLAYCAKKVKKEISDRKIPLMGMLGAFIFAAQMINFTIPGTGSSGHIGGGMILTILLGPYAAFLVIASVLLVQALFFADGGILAYGCNLFNMGIFPMFIAYPLIYKKIAGNKRNTGKIFTASIICVIVALELGAFSVVLETVASGRSELPFGTFVAAMLPIHFAIAIVEGVITALVVNFVWKAEPEMFAISEKASSSSMKKVIIGLIIATVITGGMISWFASANPDGLEWSMAKVTGKGELESPEGSIHSIMKSLQEKLAFLPDYTFSTGSEESAEKAGPAAEPAEGGSWPAVDAGTTVSGIVGGGITLLLVALIGFVLRKKGKAQCG